MEAFLLGIQGRLVQILIEDERDLEGSFPILICHESGDVGVFPTRYDPPAHKTEGEPPPPPIRFPHFPQALLGELARNPEAVDQIGELRIDVSDLPSGFVRFAFGAFTTQAARAIDSGESTVRLDVTRGKDWGLDA